GDSTAARAARSDDSLPEARVMEEFRTALGDLLSHGLMRSDDRTRARWRRLVGGLESVGLLRWAKAADAVARDLERRRTTTAAGRPNDGTGAAAVATAARWARLASDLAE
ncbi:MAG: hypothetical protein ACRDD1_19290, partial [Planctomycetia bacterium]